jgi:acetate kinase
MGPPGSRDQEGEPGAGPRLLVINCGSATLKYALFDGTSPPNRVAAGTMAWADGPGATIARAVAGLPARPDAVAHRIVHGGEAFVGPVRIDDGVLRRLLELVPLAPLHNAVALEGIAATAGLDVPQIAVFDTAYFAELPERARRYALPPLPGVRRYGFHGWSHRSVVERYVALSGSPSPTLISLHLGSGASAAAIQYGRPVDVSMGYTPLEGLIMDTRPGDVDPGLILHLIEGGMSAGELSRLLHYESGLRALAGTASMLTLLARDDPQAHGALELYCYRIVKYVGAYLAVLGGRMDALVFTGGVGHGSVRVRRMVCEALAWTGIALDQERNERGEERVSTGTAPGVYAIRSDEERAIAAEVVRFLAR